MRKLEEVIYGWLLDYMSPESAKQLAALLAHEATQYCKYQFILGFLTGSITAAILITMFK